jgi:D-alanine-D-alanine ligase
VKVGLTYTERSAARDAAEETKDRAELPDDAEEEFDSPETIAAIAAALQSNGNEVELLGDGPALASRLLLDSAPDFVFNFAEGRGISRNREAWTPALLEMFGVPYSGSDPLTLSATLDKHTAKRLVQSAGVAVPRGVLVDGAISDFSEQLEALATPLFVKPAFEGSSKGIHSHSLVHRQMDLVEAISRCGDVYQQPVVVEEFIDGDELTVGLIGNDPPTVLGIMRVVPLRDAGSFVYDLEVKRNWRQRVRYEIPARLKAAEDHAVRQSALAAFRALGCRDVARIDFRLRNEVPYFLEANPLPGLSPDSSDLVLLAEGMGIEYQELIGQILEAAMARVFSKRPAAMNS